MRSLSQLPHGSARDIAPRARRLKPAFKRYGRALGRRLWRKILRIGQSMTAVLPR